MQFIRMDITGYTPIAWRHCASGRILCEGSVASSRSLAPACAHSQLLCLFANTLSFPRSRLAHGARLLEPS